MRVPYWPGLQSLPQALIEEPVVSRSSDLQPERPHADKKICGYTSHFPNLEDILHTYVNTHIHISVQLQISKLYDL